MQHLKKATNNCLKEKMLSEGLENHIVNLALEPKNIVQFTNNCGVTNSIQLLRENEFYGKRLLFYMYFWQIDKETELQTDGR